MTSTDPRDMLFSLMGLVDSDDLLIHVDYSLSCVNVFVQCTLEMLRQRGYGILILVLHRGNSQHYHCEF
jgi:hypothetical protein